MSEEMKEVKIWPADDGVRLICCSGSGDAAVLILPGGGYNVCAPGEGVPVAERFAEMGFSAYVLNYSTRFGSFENIGGEINVHTLFPEPFQEVAAAIEYIKAQQGNIPLVLIGFSAGGHLASCYSNLWTRFGKKPDVCILGYAATELTQDEVIMKAIYGEKEHYSDEELHRYMAKELISEDTPPTFLFHSVTDPMVPARESVEYAQALSERGIAHEVHLFGCGGHAYGLGKGSAAESWPDLAERFIRQVLAKPLDYDKAEVKRISDERRRMHRPKNH